MSKVVCLELMNITFSLWWLGYGNYYLFLFRWSTFSIEWLLCKLQHTVWVWSLMRIPPLVSSYNKGIIPPPTLLGYEHVRWHDPAHCLHAHAKYIITTVTFGYVRSITNHIITMTQVPVIYHHGNKVIALWCNNIAHEMFFTVEHQFCQKLHQ